MDKDCEYCALTKSVSELISETEHWIVFVSYSQKYLGRSIVLLKNHKSSLSELSQSEWLDLVSIIKSFESSAKNVFGAEMFNWSCLMNDAYKQKEPKAHVHWHVRPRYRRPVEFAGKTFVDEAFGHHYDRLEPEKASPELMNLVADKLRGGMED